MGMGKLIVIEGVDGSGKTTQVKMLKEHLEATGIPSVAICQPTHKNAGKLVRDIMMGDESRADPRHMSLLFAADRLEQQIEVVEPAIAEGKVVVTDRYTPTSIAHQIDAGIEWIVDVNRHARKPDTIVLLEVHPDIACERLRKRLESGGSVRMVFDDPAWVKRNAELYRRACAKLAVDFYTVVDANLDADEVHAEVKRRLGF